MSTSRDSLTDMLPSEDSSFLSNLPTELRYRIVDLLAAKDVINLRLTSRAWGSVSVNGLFNVRIGNQIEHGVFSIRPHLDDMNRLRSVACYPWLARVIKHVKIYVGDLDMLEFDHEAQTVNKYSKIESMLTCERKVNSLLEQIVQNRMRHCDPIMLSYSLSKLPSVESVTATANECPFSPSEVNFTLAWMRLMRRLNREPDALYDSYDTTFPTRSSIRHLSILLATRLLQNPVRNLVLDTFPIDLFASQGYHNDDDQTGPSYEIHTNFLHDMQDMTSKVENLRIGVNLVSSNATTPEHTRVIAKSMSMFMGSMQSLRSLDVTLNMSSRFPNDSMELTSQDGFYSNTFPLLENLRVSKVRSFDIPFYSFILRHKETLKSLSLGHDFFLIPQDKPRGCVSVKSILFKLRDSLKLERFQLLVSASDQRIYDQDWQIVESSGDTLSDAKLFEMFVLGKWSWPMINVDYPHWRRLDEWKGWVRRSRDRRGILGR
ncbi:uncharacterized protein EAF01_008744 [Botrytis porri]|uniref:F-box domain-containing protein n=1 Tax=Botrytis porri TaxID=87229 RepID=A0A4Z1KE66_9HELO|nr:uncharacterized protein EAF01_008744 [Botrytis porri]KAF7897778.1 hypothetical protein EAF01_008744 [Botrytis porri]TGO84473.1 hypothetical protein BPOR_0501g00070 [Botrytis porri]